LGNEDLVNERCVHISLIILTLEDVSRLVDTGDLLEGAATGVCANVGRPSQTTHQTLSATRITGPR
jgi:hypothetical protein